MTIKKSPTKRPNKTILTIENDKSKTKEKQFAEVVLSSANINTITTLAYTKTSINLEASLKDAIAVMNENVANVNEGDTRALEARLTAQASSLDAIFNSLAMKSIGSDTLRKLETYMRLALKAQAQCARTIEVIATIKNPPVVIAKQANIAQGNQQVNNGILNSSESFLAGKTINQPNELLEVNDGSKTMDSRTAKRTK